MNEPRISQSDAELRSHVVRVLEAQYEVEKEIGRIKTALKDGIPNARTRAQEVERLEALTREAEQLELRIGQIQ